jgi:putative Mg2+ transporter-C (MgtC) family protein
MEMITIIIRFVITFILATIFGLERQKAHKPIGFGTFIFVAVGSCGLAITSIIVSEDNPLPLLGAIVTGIGFLGAGALIKTTDRISGFTSAASIWIFAIFGLAIGLGEYFIGIMLYSVIFIVFFIDSRLERRGIGSYQRKLTVITNQVINEKEVVELLNLAIKKFKLMGVDINKKDNTMTMIYQIEGRKEDINKIPKQLYEKPWFNSCKID